MATVCANDIWTRSHCADIIRAGATEFRVSSAYGTTIDHMRLLTDLRAAAYGCGVSVRVGYDLNRGTKLRIMGPAPIALRAGDEFVIWNQANSGAMWFDRDVSPPLPMQGELVFGDSDLVAVVLRHRVDGLMCKAEVDGFLRPGKAVTSSVCELGLGPINPLNDGHFQVAVEAGFDFAILSFVRSSAETAMARERLDGFGGRSVQVVTKIETREALDAVDDIAAESDAVVVARGDLAIQVGFDRLALAQWRIANRAAMHDTPFLVATQAFESALTRPRPSAADVLNVAEAAAMGAAAIILGPETCANPSGPGLVRAVAAVIAATTDYGVELRIVERGEIERIF